MHEGNEEELGGGRGEDHREGREMTDCPKGLTEMKYSYNVPKIKKKLTTRANRMEQFLWKEFYDEYIRQNSIPMVEPKHSTEYNDQYCKEIPSDDVEKKEVLANKYPVYCTTAITLWNHEGDVTKTFKKKYSITRPIAECSEKFAP
ncbi:uncharacterized protein LOC115633889 [Scaptodrosophila lebanonensis]|uniref:Uncharacterized protein LOC115633889 n=1 Tax=Drosophila lebanonensis TaxID=7225 RepID=A0A6J2UFP5_DROLE|nr:uncharacterized protein LOC115633889 [Scaptodrosophila lebanonensis]